MFRRRHHRRSGSTRGRKVHWDFLSGGVVGVALTDASAGGPESYSVWAKWPANRVDTRFTPLVYELSDETLVRTLPATNLTIGAMTGGAVLSWGLIAWDSINPAAIDSVTSHNAVPSANDGELDWLWRFPMPQGTTLAGSKNFYFPADATYLNSRAMRKLPAGTGLLLVLSYFKGGSGVNTVTVDVGFDIRMAVKRPL